MGGPWGHWLGDWLAGDDDGNGACRGHEGLRADQRRRRDRDHESRGLRSRASRNRRCFLKLNRKSSKRSSLHQLRGRRHRQEVDDPVLGVNLQVINDSGKEAELNGTGNLILGYDEAGPRPDSHNLLLGGGGNSYTSFGGIVGGSYNKISNSYASVLDGTGSTASGYASAITGGSFNVASANFATVNGDCSNITGSGTLTINAFCTNTTRTGDYASILGGAGNQASAENSAVSGGEKKHRKRYQRLGHRRLRQQGHRPLGLRHRRIRKHRRDHRRKQRIPRRQLGQRRHFQRSHRAGAELDRQRRVQQSQRLPTPPS
jgi:hypothetical protein